MLNWYTTLIVEKVHKSFLTHQQLPWPAWAGLQSQLMHLRSCQLLNCRLVQYTSQSCFLFFRDNCETLELYDQLFAPMLELIFLLPDRIAHQFRHPSHRHHRHLNLTRPTPWLDQSQSRYWLVNQLFHCQLAKIGMHAMFRFCLQDYVSYVQVVLTRPSFLNTIYGQTCWQI